MYQAVSAEGLVLAQVANVIGAGGKDEGWIVWLPHRPHRPPEPPPGRYATAEEAMVAAEVGLDAG
jgi:hypothetical protein